MTVRSSSIRGIFELLSLVLRLLAGCWLLARIPRPGAARHPFERPAASIVVPARNEAGTVPTLIASVLRERRPGDELIVVDDHSDDRTVAVAEDAGARVVVAPPLPNGWTGKNWACWAGAEASTQPLLVFLDADTELEPGGLDRLIGAHSPRGGLVSVQPFHVMRRPYERLNAFFNVVAMMGTDAFTALGERRVPTGAFGPALVSDREVYFGVGGHRAVSDRLLDDVALAREYTAAGLPVTCLGGRGTIRFRMYPGGLRHLVEGWSKNLAGGAAHTRLVTLVLIVAWVSLCIQAGWWLAKLPFLGGGVALALVAYGAVAVQLHWMLRRVGNFGAVTALLFPLPLWVFLGLFCRSVVLTSIRHRVTWKGREIVTNP